MLHTNRQNFIIIYISSAWQGEGKISRNVTDIQTYTPPLYMYRHDQPTLKQWWLCCTPPPPHPPSCPALQWERLQWLYKLSIHNGENDDENNNEAWLEGQHSGRDRTEAPYIFANVNHDYGAWKGRFSKVLQGITRYYKVLQGITILIKMMMMIS